MCSLIRAFASLLKTIDRLALKFLSLKGGRTGLSEPIRAKMSQCPCADQEGDRGQTPWKITSYSYMGFYWTPTPGKSWTPTWKMCNKTIGPPL